MAQQPDDPEEKIWERPWSTEEMRKSADDWNLAADAGLLKHLQEFSQTVLSHTHATEKALDSLLENLNTTNTNINNVTNDFLCLANTQFVESRVYDDDDVESPRHTQHSAEKLTEGDVMTKVRTALSFGVALLDTMLEPGDQNAVGNDTDFLVGSRCVERKNPYLSRPLPHLIGSAAFMADDNVGLVGSERDRDQPAPKTAAMDDVSMYSDESILTPSVTRHVDDNSSNTSFGLGDETPVQRKKTSDDVASVGGPESNSVAAREGGSFATQLAEKLAGMVPADARLPSQNASGDEEAVKQVRTSIQKGDTLFAPYSDDEEDDALFSNRSGLFSGGKGLFDDRGTNFNSGSDPSTKDKSKTVPAASKASVATDLFASGSADDDGDDLFTVPVNKEQNLPTNTDKQPQPRPLSIGDIISQAAKQRNTIAAPASSQGNSDAIKTASKAAMLPEDPRKKVPGGGKSMYGAAGITITKEDLRRRPSWSSSQGSEEGSSAQVVKSKPPGVCAGGNGGGSLFSSASADEDDLFDNAISQGKAATANGKSLFSPYSDQHRDDLVAIPATPPKTVHNVNVSSPLEKNLFSSGPKLARKDSGSEQKKDTVAVSKSRGLFDDDDDGSSDDDQSLFTPKPSNKPPQTHHSAPKTDFFTSVPPPLPAKSEEKVKKSVSLFDDSDSGDEEFLFSSASSAGSRRSQASTDILNSSVSGSVSAAMAVEKKPLRKGLFDNEDSLFGSSQLDAPDVDIFTSVPSDSKKSGDAPPPLPVVAHKAELAAKPTPSSNPASLRFESDHDLFSVNADPTPLPAKKPVKKVKPLASGDHDDLFSAKSILEEDDLFRTESIKPAAPKEDSLLPAPDKSDSEVLFRVPTQTNPSASTRSNESEAGDLFATKAVPTERIPEEPIQSNLLKVEEKAKEVKQVVSDCYDLFGSDGDDGAVATSSKPTLTISDEKEDAIVVASKSIPTAPSGNEQTPKTKPLPPNTLDIRNTTDPKLGSPFDDDDDDDSDDLFKPSMPKIVSAIRSSLERSTTLVATVDTSSLAEKDKSGSISNCDESNTPTDVVRAASVDSAPAQLRESSEKAAITSRPEKGSKPTPVPRKPNLRSESKVATVSSDGAQDILRPPQTPIRAHEKPSPIPSQSPRDTDASRSQVDGLAAEVAPTKAKPPVAGIRLNINPLALLPGAQPPKKKTPGEEPVGFDQPIENCSTLHIAQKERVKPGSKRRPPSRRARQEAARNRQNADQSGSDLDAKPSTLASPSTILSPSTDEDDLFGVPQDLPPDAARWPFNVGGAPILSPSPSPSMSPPMSQSPAEEQTASNKATQAGSQVGSQVGSLPQTTTVVDDPLLKMRGEVSSEADTDADPVPDGVLDADADDHSSLFAFVKKKPKEPQAESLFSRTPTLPTRADSPPVHRGDLTDHGDYDDDDLFKPTAKIASMKSTVVSSTGTKTWKLSDDDDDDEDLFMTGSKAGLKGSSGKDSANSSKEVPGGAAKAPDKVGKDAATKRPVKSISSNLFDDDDDDLFSSAVSKTAPLPKTSQGAVSIQKKSESASETKAALFDDPLSGPP